MMQVINTLLGRRASSRHRVEVPITWKVPWGQGRQKRSSPRLAQHAGGAGPTLAVLLTRCAVRPCLAWRECGIGNAPDLSCWCPGTCHGVVLLSWECGSRN